VLDLERPLICVDVETHDKCPPEKSYIIEMGLIVFYHDGRPTKKWQSFFRLPPSVLIHPAATEVHKITMEMLEETREHEGKDIPKWPLFSQSARNLAGGMRDCDFCGYNVDFDLRAIMAGMKRAGVEWSYEGAHLLDPMNLWRKLQPRTNSDFVREYAGREPSGAHRALNDIQDTVDGAMGFFQRHKLPRTVQECHGLCKDPEAIDSQRKFVFKGDVPIINFGKWSGTPMTNVARDYYAWMMKGEFSPDTLRVVSAALNGVFPKKETV